MKGEKELENLAFRTKNSWFVLVDYNIADVCRIGGKDVVLSGKKVLDVVLIWKCMVCGEEIHISSEPRLNALVQHTLSKHLCNHKKGKVAYDI